MQEKVHNLYDFEDSYEIVPVHGPADHASASTSAGHTITTSNNPYYARRTLVDSIAFEPRIRQTQQCEYSA